MDVEQVVYLAPIAFVVIGLVALLQMPEPYRSIGGGELALDVPDTTAAAPLHSAVGQAEVAQLLEAVAFMRDETASRHRSGCHDCSGGGTCD